MKQNTLKRAYVFEGKGLHTGAFSHVCIKPAPEDSGIRFVRTDLGVEIPALAENVANTARCTVIAKGGASVSTVEHLMSALTGMGVDNALIEIDNAEVPILDGSALPYAGTIAADGLAVQAAERRYLVLSEAVEVHDEPTGSWVKVEPSDRFSCECTSDFNSRVLGVQTAGWDEGSDYLGQIAPCRTFVFFHEVEYLASKGLVKGGDVDNAIVVVEHPVPDEVISSMAERIGRPSIKVTPQGYLDNITLHFSDECGRHKLLDLIGDIRLSGGFPLVKVTAYKPGHTINNAAARAVQNLLK